MMVSVVAVVAVVDEQGRRCGERRVGCRVGSSRGFMDRVGVGKRTSSLAKPRATSGRPGCRADGGGVSPS